MRVDGSVLAERVMQEARRARIELAAIVTGASALVGAHPFAFAAATFVSAAVGVWLDMKPWHDWIDSMLVIGMTMLLAGALQYCALRLSLGPGLDRGRTRAVLAPLVAVSIHCLVALVSSAAYLLLLVPGLYLAGRLSPAAGVAIIEREGVVASIVEGWRRTRASWWPLLLAQAILLAPLIGLFGLVAAATFLEWGTLATEEASLEVALVSNLILSAITAAGWALNGAVYQLTAPDTQRDEEIFA
jgi:hypothetical protein